MQNKLLQDHAGQRTFLVVLQKGDEIMSCLQRFAETERITAAQITALGAFERAELSFFEWESKEYLPIPVEEQVEVASLVGDIALDRKEKPSLHLHAVLGRRDGSTISGHLAMGLVRPTLETVVTDTPAHLHRLKDDETGLALIRPRIG